MTQVHERRKKATKIVPGRRERRKAETRERLFRAAMRLFAERGFSKTTTESITEAADVGQGTFFNYFPSKHHVLTVLSEKQIEKVTAARRDAVAGKTSVRGVLHGLMHAIAEEPGRSQALTRSLFTTFISNDQVRELTRDTTAWNNYRSSSEIVRADQLSMRDARDLVVLAVGGAYLQVIAAGARVLSAHAQLETATAPVPTDLAAAQGRAGGAGGLGP